MHLLHNIGPRHNSNYNTPEEIAASKGILSFDGIYKNVYDNHTVLKDREVFLFVMGCYVGKDNSFEPEMPLEQYCTWDQIMELCHKYRCKLGWHTWTHKNLKWLSDDEIIKEITPPIPMKYLAYPYGDVDERVADLVAQAGYEEAWSVVQGDGSQFQRKRSYLNW